MSPQTKELLNVLNELITLLEEGGQTHGSEWIKEVCPRINNSDYSGIEYLGSVYGRMGSLMA